MNKIIPRGARPHFEDGKPGLYAAVPEAVYHGFDACSSHRLGALRRSPMHCWQAIHHPAEPTAAMRLGTAVHLAILEPERFEDEIFVMNPYCEARTKKGAPCQYAPKIIEKISRRQVCGVHAKEEPLENVTAISRDDLAKVREIERSVRSHQAARALLEGHQSEVSALWMQGPLLCKGRIDSWREDLETIIDVKTSSDASPNAFQRTVANYGYHRQGAMYVDGGQALGLKVKHFTIIAVETEPPFAVAVYRLTDETLAVGADELTGLMGTYHECHQSNRWPAYPDVVQDLRLPAWAIKQYYEEI